MHATQRDEDAIENNKGQNQESDEQAGLPQVRCPENFVIPERTEPEQVNPGTQQCLAEEQQESHNQSEDNKRAPEPVGQPWLGSGVGQGIKGDWQRVLSLSSEMLVQKV